MFPDDSIQGWLSPSPWWEKTSNENLERGSLIFTFIPFFEDIPNSLVIKGRKEADAHDTAIVEAIALRIQDPPPRPELPVAALPLHEGEYHLIFKAKKRPCLVIGEIHQDVPAELRKGMPRKNTASKILVAPYYGVDQDGSRGGFKVRFAQQVRHARFPQFFWDKLPIGGVNESILRLDHVQPMGKNYFSYKLTGFKLSDDAIGEIMNDWLYWVIFGGLPEENIIDTFRDEMVRLFGY